MAMRKVVVIDEAKCDGCGDCVTSCAEGAIAVIDGKARLVSEIYCDGLGACLGHCPEGAITIEPREAAAFDEKAVQTHLAPAREPPLFVCPGLAAHQFQPREAPKPHMATEDVPSELTHWPIQLKLVSPTAPQFATAD